MKAIGASLAVFFGLCIVGCAGQTDDAVLLDDADQAAVETEDVANAEQAFSTGTCGTVAANLTQSGGAFVTTPRTYNNCGKGYVLDINDFFGTSNHFNGGTGAGWSDTQATNSTDCQKQFMRAYLYERTSNGNVLKKSVDRYGVWVPAGYFVAHCEGPYIEFGGNMAAGKDYRIAVTARTANSSAAPTRAVSIVSSRIW